jgi:hypothetical protein
MGSLPPHERDHHTLPRGVFPPTGENLTPTMRVSPPRGRSLHSPNGSLPPHGGDHHTPPGGVVQKHISIKASRSEIHHTPHRGSLSPLGEIIILSTGEVFPHRGRSSYSPRGSRSETLTYKGVVIRRPSYSPLAGSLSPLPTDGGVFPHRGRSKSNSNSKFEITLH